MLKLFIFIKTIKILKPVSNVIAFAAGFFALCGAADA